MPTPSIPAARAAHVMFFVAELERLGIEVEPERVRAHGLPAHLGEDPDAAVPLIPCFRLIDGIRRERDLEDLGWLASRRFALGDLRPEFVATAREAATLSEALALFIQFVQSEDNVVDYWFERHLRPGRVKVCSLLPLDLPGEALRLSEWVQVMAVVAMVRAFVGPDWAPDEIGFRHGVAVGGPAQSALPRTRFSTGQDSTWVAVPTDLMDYNYRGGGGSMAAGARARLAIARARLLGGDLAASLKELLKSYLSSGYPDISLAANATGLAKRTLQRRLAFEGTSYSRVVEAARFELASEILSDPGQKVIDVALRVGYDDPSHFARAFSRTCGLSPSDYRRHFCPTERATVVEVS